MPIRYEEPDITDGAAMWALARDSGSLDLNSPYYYLTFSSQFSDTSIVAKTDEGDLAGFIAGFLPSDSPDTLFVWQIATSPDYRGRGIAHRMLRTLLSRLAESKGVCYLAATVTPSNSPSQRMFRSFAEKLSAPCEETPFFEREHFPAGDHEEERLLRIGPFSPSALIGDEGKPAKQGETPMT